MGQHNEVSWSLIVLVLVCHGLYDCVAVEAIRGGRTLGVDSNDIDEGYQKKYVKEVARVGLTTGGYYESWNGGGNTGYGSRSRDGSGYTVGRNGGGYGVGIGDPGYGSQVGQGGGYDKGGAGAGAGAGAGRGGRTGTGQGGGFGSGGGNSGGSIGGWTGGVGRGWRGGNRPGSGWGSGSKPGYGGEDGGANGDMENTQDGGNVR